MSDEIEEFGPEKLWVAAGKGGVQKVKEILRNNPTLVNWRNKEEYSNTALHHACLCGHDSIVAILLAHPDIDVNQKDSDGATPFMFACRNGNTSCVRLLLKDQRVKVNERSNTGYTPLWWAAHFGQLDTIKWWIASGREMDLGQPRDVDKTDAIGKAKKRGQTEVATLLEGFKENPIKTRSEVRDELEITGQYIYHLSFISFSLTESELVKLIRPSIRFPSDHSANTDQRAVSRLP